MSRYLNRITIVAGIAIFSMFFGAGNTVFPLLLGQVSGDKLWYAFAGLLITAVGGPIVGLTGSLLYQGKCRSFFSTAGPYLGFFFLAACLCLVGPFAGLPRCVIIAYAALLKLTTFVNRYVFIGAFSVLALIASVREKNLIKLLGCILSPTLIVALLSIIGIAIATGNPLPATEITATNAFLQGLTVGYDTLDMIAAIIFSSSIWMLLGVRLQEEGELDPAEITRISIMSGIIGGFLLGLIYVGLSLATAFHAESLAGVPPEELLPTLAMTMLGPWFGAVANIAVSLACFTTVISLMCSLAAIIQKEFLHERVDRKTILIVMTLITVAFACTSFGSLMSLIHPVISFCYPAIIILTLYNTFSVLYGWKKRHSIVYMVTAASAASILLGA